MDNWHDAKTDPPKKVDFYIATLITVNDHRYVQTLFYRPMKKGWMTPDMEVVDGEDVLYWMDFPDPKED